MDNLQILSTVALLEDVAQKGLRRGQVGTIVDRWNSGLYEVEFCGDDGRTYALEALRAEQLILLLHQPSSQAA